MKTYRSALRSYGGVPTIFVNDAPVSSMMMMYEGRTFMKSVYPGMYLIHEPPPAVRADDASISPQWRERIEWVLEKEPDALLALYTFPWAKKAWAAEHPDDLQLFEPEVEASGLVAPEHRAPSFASKSWRESFVEYYEKFARLVHETYGGRVVMQNFGSGSCGEWNPWGAPDFYGRWFLEDLSPAMHDHFRRWLRERYHDEVSELRYAWSDPKVKFETVTVPGRQERLQSDWFTFRDPRKRKVADYYQAYADAIGDAVMAFGSTIKRVTNNEVIVSSHCGGMLDNGLHAFFYHQTQVNSLRRVIRSGAIDCFAGPVSYIGRKAGGSPSPMVPAGSLRLHGKTRLQDQDTRTCVQVDLTKVVGNSFLTFFGVPQTMPESVAVLKRDVGRSIIAGASIWWHDLPKGNYDHPEIEAVLARLTEIGRVVLHLERGLIPDMIAFADELSVFHQQCANRLLYSLIYAQRVETFSHAGISWEIFEQGDFTEPNLPDSKLVLMLNPFLLTREEIAAIRAKLAGSGRTVVWFVAPGIQSPAGFDLEAVQALTGFRVRAFDAEANPRVSLTNYNHPITKGLGSMQAPHCFGTGFLGNDEREGIYGPILYIDDPEAEVLGVVDALYKPGLAVKAMDGWTSIYSCAPRLSRPLLRNLAKFVGMHNYLDTEDMIAVTPELILLHGVGVGKRTLRFPTARDVVDLWTGETLARSVVECSVDMAEYDTKLIFHGKLDRYEAACRKAK